MRIAIRCRGCDKLRGEGIQLNNRCDFRSRKRIFAARTPPLPCLGLGREEEEEEKV